jgi:hypothetical protein
VFGKSSDNSLTSQRKRRIVVDLDGLLRIQSASIQSIASGSQTESFSIGSTSDSDVLFNLCFIAMMYAW